MSVEHNPEYLLVGARKTPVYSGELEPETFIIFSHVIVSEVTYIFIISAGFFNLY